MWVRMLKKILLISPSKVFGGGETYILSLTSVLDQYDVSVLCLNEKLYDLLTSKKVRAVKLKSKARLILTLLTMIFKKDCILVFNGLPESRLSAFIFFFKPFVLVTHSTEEWGEKYDRNVKNRVRSKLNKFLYDKRSVNIVAVCDYAKRNLESSIKRAQITRIYNHANLPSKNLEIKSEKVELTFGFMGRLSNEKGIEEFIDIMKIYESLKLTVTPKFIVAGDGYRKTELEDFISSLKYVEVRYIGFTKACDFFDKIDCYLLPSRTEACSIALLEAMSWGVPTIAFRVGGNPELIENGIHGFLAQAGNVEDFYNCMQMLNSDRNMLLRFRENCILRYNEKFSRERFHKSYEVLFENMI